MRIDCGLGIDVLGRTMRGMGLEYRNHCYNPTTTIHQMCYAQLICIGIATLGTCDKIFMVSGQALQLPTKDRLHSSGTNRSDCMGPFEKPAKKNVWRVQQKEKANLYGPALVDCGSKVEGDAGPDKDPAAKSTETVPFAWHPWGNQVYEELSHSYSVSRYWHLTAADTTLPLHCIRQKIGYIGFCCTQKHVDALHETIINDIFESMQEEDDALYEPELVSALNADNNT